MANFELIKDQIMPIEGGYVFDPDDPGGETKYGISKLSYPHLDIKNLSIEDACVIYKRDFWDVMRLDEVKDQSISEQTFWFGVNSGTVEAIKLLQKIINKYRWEIDQVKIDGLVGKNTLKALNDLFYFTMNNLGRFSLMLDSLKLEQINYYASLVNNTPIKLKFLLGWINRVFKT